MSRVSMFSFPLLNVYLQLDYHDGDEWPPPPSPQYHQHQNDQEILGDDEPGKNRSGILFFPVVFSST